MTLTHEQIAGMTAVQVNKEIAIRRGYPSTVYVAYCGDWELAGRLLEEMVTEGVSGCPIIRYHQNKWTCLAECNDEYLRSVKQEAPTPTEAIARCWLEWWKVTHG